MRVAAAFSVLLGLTLGAACTSDRVADTTIAPTTAGPVSTVSPVVTTAPSLPPPTPVPATVPPTTAQTQRLLRPYVDPAICSAVWAGEGEFHDLSWDPYALSSDAPVLFEVFADPDLGPAAPFAVLVQYANRPLSIGGTVTDVNGRAVTQLAEGNGRGNGGVFWNLPDGGQAYLRTRDLDNATAVDIVRALVERPDGGGFDVDASLLPPPFSLVAEGDNLAFSGSGAGITCVTPSKSYWYRINTFVGDPVSIYVILSDRPPPIEVGYVDGTLVSISGLADDTAPTLADIVEPDEATWAWVVGASRGGQP